MRKIKSLEWFLLVIFSPVLACSMIGGDANEEPKIPSPSATTPRGGGGEKIAFLSGEYSNLTRLTNNEVDERDPVWQP